MMEKIVTCYDGCPFYSNWEGLLDLCMFFTYENSSDPLSCDFANLDGICLRGVTEEALKKYLKSELEDKVGK